MTAPAARLRSCLDAVAARESELHAFARLDPTAPAQAAAAPPGPLHGMPVAVKDIIATAGLGTEYGADTHRGHVPEQDADCVTRLRRAGAVLIGKTVTTEFAHLRPGPTRNPHDPARTPGGSSSGSAAAVAAGMAEAALGTQTGGSVIRPASYCGVFGFKSSMGRTDMQGVHELAGSLDTLGWFTRSAADLALLATVLLDRWELFAGRPRFARLRTPFDGKAEPEIVALCDRAARSVGAAEAMLPACFATAADVHQRLVSVEAARAFAPYEGRLSPILSAFTKAGRNRAAGHASTLAEAALLRAEFSRALSGFDALILPAATGEAPLGLQSTGDAAFSLPFSLIGAPCASVPLGRGRNGLPLGVQIVGLPGGDEAVLAAAAVLAQ